MISIRRLVGRKPTAARFFKAACWAVLAGLLASAGRPAFAAEPLDERAATRRICSEGPDAGVARAQRLRGSAEVTAAGVLPNPALVAEHQRSLSGPRERETIVGLSVPLGLAGRRSLLRDAARERQSRAHSEAEDTVFESALAFREAYVQAAAANARVSLLSERQLLLDGFSEMIQGLARGGEVAGYDLLRQQAQARMHASAVETAKARSLSRQKQLEAWVGSPITFQARYAELDERSGAVRPASSARVRAFEAAARASALEVRAADRKWVPDVEVFAGYRQVTTGPETGRGLALALTLPVTLFDHGQGDAARAAAERELALASAARLRREQQVEHQAVRVLLDGLVEALRSAQDASTRAVEVETKASALYAAGEATITELLEAFRVAEQAQLEKLALEEEIATARIRLMRALGSMFDAALDHACRDKRGRTR
jgi:cobalt-zinc-cadmium efflux system outer membrane protein